MAVIVTSYGKVARRSLRYPKAAKQGTSRDNPRVLRSAGINCSIEGADRVFAGLRRKHGSKGAQTFQTILSLSKAEADPSNPDDWDLALDLGKVIANDALPPGTPSVIYVQADGKTGCLHAHIVSCTTIPKDCELDGKVWKAGRKLSREWTETHAYRARANAAMATIGFENTLQDRPKPDMMLTKYETGIRLRQREFDEQQAAGTLEPGAKRPVPSWRMDLMSTIEDALEDPRSTSWDGLDEVLTEQGAGFRHRVLKGGRTTVTWLPPGRAQGVRGSTLDEHLADLTSDPDYEDLEPGAQRAARSAAKTQFHRSAGTASLGDYFTYESVSEMLAQNAQGLPRRRIVPPQKDDRPEKETPAPTQAAIDRAREVAQRLVAIETEERRRDDVEAWLRQRDKDGTLWELDEALDLYGTVEYVDSNGETVRYPARGDAHLWWEESTGLLGQEDEDRPERAVDVLGEDRLDRLAGAMRRWGNDAQLREDLLGQARQRRLDEQREIEEHEREQQEGSTSASAPEAPLAPAGHREHEPAPVAASAPTGSSQVLAEPYVSRLRRLRPKNEKTREKLLAAIELDETQAARLRAGERVDEAAVKTVGVGQRWLETFGKYLDPDLKEELDRREEMKVARRSVFDDHKQHAEKVLDLERTRSGFDPDVLAARRARDQARRWLVAYDRGMAAGEYGEVAPPEPVRIDPAKVAHAYLAGHGLDEDRDDRGLGE